MEVLTQIRKAMAAQQSRTHLAAQNTQERSKKKVELMGKKESEEIMENLMAKMVHRPTLFHRQKEEEMNTKIEKIFELELFQKLVGAANSTTMMSDVSNSQSFINQSQYIQRQIQQNMSYSNILPTHSQLIEEE